MSRHRLHWLGWMAAGAAACASGSSAPLRAPPAPAAGVPAERPADPMSVVTYGPGAVRYHVHRRIESVQEYAGAEQRATLGFGIFFAAEVRGPADSLGYAATFTIDSVTVDSGVVLPAVINLDLARGLRFAGVLTPAGEFRDGTPSDSGVARSLAQIIGGFREFYPRIRPSGISLGSAWTDTVAHIDQFGLFDQVSVTSIHTARADAWEDRGGIRSLRLEVRSVVSLTGSGQQAGQPVELTGSGTRSGVEFVALDGRYLGGVSRDSTALTITLRAQGLVVPVRQVALSTVQVLP